MIFNQQVSNSSKNAGLIGLLVLILTAITVWPIIFPTQSVPKLLISDVSGSVLSFGCGVAAPDLLPHEIKFKVASVGERDIQTKVFFGVRDLGQSNNSCGNFTFFENRTICSISTDPTGTYDSPCSASLEPIKKTTEPLNVKIGDLNAVEVANFLNKTAHLESCSLSESIEICAYYENNWHDCSEPSQIFVSFKACK